MFRLFECCALSFFERFVLSFSLKIERFVSDSAEIWICGLYSGASGNVVIPSVYKDCIIIPQGATVQMQDKTIAYKVVDGKAVSTLISVAGINDGREYVVLDGLKAGDEIISEGAGLIREGTVVK